MLSSVQNALSSIPGPFTIARAAVELMMEYRSFSSSYTVLQQCLDKLEHIDALLNGLSVERQRKINTAAQRGSCRKLRDARTQLDMLFEEYHSLCRVYEESYFHDCFRGTLLHNYLLDFEKSIVVFSRDVWNTTRPGDRAINWAEFK